MNEYDFEGGFDRDEHDDDTIWSEADWRQFLNRHSAEVERFRFYYQETEKGDDQLDRITQMMGWEQLDWFDMEFGGFDPVQPTFESLLQFSEDDESPDESDPYTIHRHPLYVIAKALYQLLYDYWEQIMVESERNLPNDLVWRYAKSLREGESQALLSIQVLDLGDYTLAICHLKSSLSAVNESLRALSELPMSDRPDLCEPVNSANRALFRLREVWLRTMRACREETQRQFPETD